MTTISLNGIVSNLANEERVLLLLSVIYNDEKYEWQRFALPDTTIDANYLNSLIPSVEQEISYKLEQWNSTDKTPTNEIDNLSGDSRQVEINKHDVVKPDNPDYYSLRRNEYPKIGEQLDAFWKGQESTEYKEMIKIIQDIKIKYPKPAYL